MGNETLALSSISSSLAAVAQIGALRGEVVILRASGGMIVAKEGDNIYESDIVATASDAAALIVSQRNDILTLGHSSKIQFTPAFNQNIASNYQYASLGVGEKFDLNELINGARNSNDANNLESLFPAPSAGPEKPPEVENQPVRYPEPLEHRPVYGEGEFTIWQRTDAEVIPVGGYTTGSQEELEAFFRSLSNSEENIDHIFDREDERQPSDSQRSETAQAEVRENIIARNDVVSVDEDQAVSGNVSANDSSDLGGVLSYSVLSSVSNGTLVFNANGSYTYTPNNNYTGTDTFVYQVVSSNGGVAQATVSITVGSTDDLSSSPGNLAIAEDAGAVAGDLSTDNTTTSGGSLTYAVAAGGSPDNGTLVINADGSYSYQPNDNFHGADSFQYLVTDADSGESAVQTVSITISAVADLSSNAGNLNILEDPGAVASNLSGDNSTTSGGALSYALAPGGGPSNGALVLNADGSYSYTPNDNFHGADSFQYIVTDADSGESSVQTVSITVDSVADLSSSEGSLSLTEDTGAAAGNVSSDNATTSGGALSYALAPGGNPTNGALVLNDDGSYSYTPSKNFSGDDSFQYVVTDSASGESTIQTVSITVEADVEIPASPAIISESIAGLPDATGLLYQTYVGLPYPDSRTAESASGALQESQFLTDTSPTTVTTRTDGFTDLTNISAKSLHTITGLVYLEAGTKYQFSGYLDDILHIELGGTTMMSTTGNSFGSFGPSGTDNSVKGPVTDGGTFIPAADGFYTLEVYAGNHGGSGNFKLDIVIDDVEQSLSNDNLTLYSAASDVVTAGGRIEDFVAGDSGDGGYFPLSSTSSVSGIEDTTISISHLTVTPQGTDTLVSTVLESIPVGAVVTDGSNSFTATLGSTSVDISSWNLTSLTITPPSGSTADIDLTVRATTESTTAQTTTTTLDFTVSVVAKNYADSVDPQVAGTLPDEAVVSSDNEIPASTGLLSRLYSGLPYPDSRTADSTNGALQESTILAGQTPDTITREINGYSSTVNIPGKGAYVLTGLIYLEAGSTYQFSGYMDDILRIELGGTVMMNTTGNSFGSFGPEGTSGSISGSHTDGGSFTPAADGYYTLEVYAGNHGGAGGFNLSLWVDGVSHDLSADNFGLYSSVDDLTSAGANFTDFVAGDDTADGGYFPYSESASTGAAGAVETDIAGPVDDADSDFITGTAGNDILTAGASGNVILHGNDGNDNLTGNASENLLAGGVGEDTLAAGGGSDIIQGGKGSDSLSGGEGADTFIWKSGDADGSTDTITDFVLGAGGDTINLADVLQNVDTGSITDFLSVSYDAVSGDSTISVDANGAVGGSSDDLSIVIKSLDLTAIGGGTQSGILNQLVTDGNLIVDS